MAVSPVFVLNLLLTVIVTMLPFYILRRVRTVLLEPNLYSTV